MGMPEGQNRVTVLIGDRAVGRQGEVAPHQHDGNRVTGRKGRFMDRGIEGAGTGSHTSQGRCRGWC